MELWFFTMKIGTEFNYQLQVLRMLTRINCTLPSYTKLNGSNFLWQTDERISCVYLQFKYEHIQSKYQVLANFILFFIL